MDDINYEVAIAREKLVRHDVMSHVYAYGLQCPKARASSIWARPAAMSATTPTSSSCARALQLVRKKLIGVLAKLAKFAEEYKDMPCLAYTHCQPAQPTTVGKRATLWANELYMDLQEIDHRSPSWRCAASRAPPAPRPALWSCSTATPPRSRAVEADVCAQMGFTKVVPVCGQTYSRKVDYKS